MTDTTAMRDPQADGADHGRRRPSTGDRGPLLALALGAGALAAAPVVLWAVDVGPLGLLVPVAGLAAVQVTARYAGAIDYSPPGDPVMRLARLGRLLGILAVTAFIVGGAVRWGWGNERLANVPRFLFNPEFIGRALPDLFTEGLRITLIVWLAAVGLGQVLGLVLALMGVSRRRAVRLLALIYIDIFRGLPAIVTIVLVGIGLPLTGVRPFGRNQVWYAAFALGLIATAYIAEIVRAGIQSVDEGQVEAARSLGMPYVTAMRLIVIPQGIRRVIPALTNEYIALLKDTSLIFVLGLSANATSFWDGRDLFRVGQNLAQQYGNYSTITAAGLFYLALTIPLTRLTNHLDRRLREGRAVDEREDPLDDAPLEGTTLPGSQP